MADFTKEIAIMMQTNAQEVTQKMTDLTTAMRQYGEAAKACKKEQAELDEKFKEGKISAEEYDAKTAVINKNLKDLSDKTAKAKNDLKQLNATNISDLWNGFKTGIKSATSLTGAINVTKAAFSGLFKMIMANPWAALATLIATVVVKAFQELSAAFKKNDDAGTALNRVMSILQTPVKILSKLMASLAGVLGKVFDAIADGVVAVTKFTTKMTGAIHTFANWIRSITEGIPVLRQLGKIWGATLDGIANAGEAVAGVVTSNDELIKSTDALEEKRRQWSRTEKQLNRELAEARERLNDTELSPAERKKAGEQVLSIEKKLKDGRVALIDEEIRIERLRQRVENDTSDEAKDRIVDLQNQREDAIADYSNSVRRLNREITRNSKEVKTTVTDDAEEIKKAILATANTSIGNAQKETLKLIAEQTKDYQSAFNVLKAEYDEDINKLQAENDQFRALLKDKTQTLTEEQRKQLNAAIQANEALMTARSEKFAADEEALIEKMKGTAEIEKNIQKLKVDAIIDEQEREKASKKTAYDTAVAEAKSRFTKEQQETEEFQEYMRLLEEGYQKDITDIDKKYADRRAAQEEKDRQEKIEKEKKAKEENFKNSTELLSSTADIFGSIAQAYNDEYQKIVAGKDELTAQEKEQAIAALERQKAATLAQIALQQAVSIANIIASATKVASNPLALAATIAAGVATLTSGIMQAYKTIEGIDSQIDEVKKFSTGGYVEGAGTTTSDSIPARLSNGEAVINARSTSMFYDLLSRINQAGGGVAFPNAQNSPILHFARGGVANNTQTMIEAVKTAVKGVQPVVSVKEITKVQNKLKLKEI